MKFTKSKLISIIKENLTEMPMDFDTQDRPDQGLQDKLAAGETPLKKVPLPKTARPFKLGLEYTISILPSPKS